MSSRTVPGFLPSTSGFAFVNSFPHIPVRRIGIPGVLSLGIGDASNGLCGGMAFAARDYFEVDRAPPHALKAPTEGPLFDYLVDRLFDSFDLPLGPIRYLQLMNPTLPDVETVWSRLGFAPHGRLWRTRMVEWPRIRADIDAGYPSPLGMVRVKSFDPFALKENHQVLAYGYEILGGSFRLRLYDPNLPNRDDVTLTVSWASPMPRPISCFPPGPAVHAFFRVRYKSSKPP